MLNLNDVSLFVRVVEAKGFAAAGRALGMPKSSLSKRIAALETELGARLIHRTTRSFAVTELGQEFYRHGAAMLTEAQCAEDAVRMRLAAPAGTVRLTCSVAMAHTGLAQVLADFAAAFPQVRLVLNATNRTVDLVNEGVDLAVRAHDGPLPGSGLVQRRLGFTARWLVAAPSYIERTGRPATPEALAGRDGLSVPSLALEAGWPLQHIDGTESRGPVTHRLCSDDLQTLKLAALQGLGIATLPDSLCRAEIAAGTFERVLPEWTAGGATVTLLTVTRRGQLPSVRALSDFIARRLPVVVGLDLATR